MAYYETIQDYLYDQFLLPLEKAIREGNEKEALSIAVFFAEKHIKLNAFAKGHEEYVKEKYNDKNDMPVLEYMKKYVEPFKNIKKWKDCQVVYSNPKECETDFDNLEVENDA